jgi:hypothetical protein
MAPSLTNYFGVAMRRFGRMKMPTSTTTRIKELPLIETKKEKLSLMHFKIRS